MNTSPQTLHNPAARRGRLRTLTGGSVLVLAIGMLLIAGMLGAARAQALLQQVQETGQPGYLSLQADQVEPHWQNLKPADRVFWQLEANLADAPEADLALELRSEGELVSAANMLVAVTTCTELFQQLDEHSTPQCPGDVTQVLAETSLGNVAQPASGTIFELAQLTAAHPRNVLVTLGPAAHAQPAAMAGTSMKVGVGFHAKGVTSQPGNDIPKPPGLVATGVDVALILLAIVGIILLAVGIGLLRSTGGVRA